MKKCELCNKLKMTGHNVSHSNRKTKRIFRPNLVKARVRGKKMLICAKCLKALSKN